MCKYVVIRSLEHDIDLVSTQIADRHATNDITPREADSRGKKRYQPPKTDQKARVLTLTDDIPRRGAGQNNRCLTSEPPLKIQCKESAVNTRKTSDANVSKVDASTDALITSGTSRQFECSYKCCWRHCDFENKSSVVFKRHLEIHLNKKPYACPAAECKFTSGTKISIKSHIIHHAIIPPYSCSIENCSYGCYRQADILKHVRKHGKGIVQVQKEKTSEDIADDPSPNQLLKTEYCKPYYCPWPGCHFDCAQAYTLRKHLELSHKRKLPLEEHFQQMACNCNDCKTKFNERENLKLRTACSTPIHQKIRGGRLNFIKIVPVARRQVNFLSGPSCPHDDGTKSRGERQDATEEFGGQNNKSWTYSATGIEVGSSSIRGKEMSTVCRSATSSQHGIAQTPSQHQVSIENSLTKTETASNTQVRSLSNESVDQMEGKRNKM